MSAPGSQVGQHLPCHILASADGVGRGNNVSREPATSVPPSPPAGGARQCVIGLSSFDQRFAIVCDWAPRLTRIGELEGELHIYEVWHILNVATRIR